LNTLYHRASVLLIIQRRQLGLLLQQCRSAEAEQVQKIVDQLDIMEKRQAAKAMQYEYE
jgi:hypothetical protein